jgi:dTDP-4-dehydrorhamnose reductase
MNILVTGANGQLGNEMRILAKNSNDTYIFTDVNHVEGIETIFLDITDLEAIRQMVKEYNVNAIVNCAAWTNVDGAEDPEKYELVEMLNATAPENLATAMNEVAGLLVHISTDYVFDGDSERPYCEADCPTGGRTVYGQSKFAGEEAVRRLCPNHVVARISWLYGAGGPSFVHAMMALADGSRPVLKVVADQRGNPTSTVAVARKLREILLLPELCGTFHLTCEGEATWAEFAEEIFRLARKEQRIQPCTTEEFPRPAPRPKNSCLEKKALRNAGLMSMPNWKDALAEFMTTEFDI